MSAKPSPHMSYHISPPSFIALMCDAQITGENCLKGWDVTTGSNTGYHNTQLERWQRKTHLSTQQRHLSTHAMYISLQLHMEVPAPSRSQRAETKRILGTCIDDAQKKHADNIVVVSSAHTYASCCVIDCETMEKWTQNAYSFQSRRSTRKKLSRQCWKKALCITIRFPAVHNSSRG